LISLEQSFLHIPSKDRDKLKTTKGKLTMSKIAMVKAKVDKEYLITAEGNLFNSKYDLFDAVFGGISVKR